MSQQPIEIGSIMGYSTASAREWMAYPRCWLLQQNQIPRHVLPISITQNVALSMRYTSKSQNFQHGIFQVLRIHHWVGQGRFPIPILMNAFQSYSQYDGMVIWKCLTEDILSWKFSYSEFPMVHDKYHMTRKFPIGGFHKWGYPKIARWLISWTNPNLKWMVTGGTPMTQVSPPIGNVPSGKHDHK